MLSELIIDRKSGKPVSLQIAHFVRAKIHGKQLSPGDKLPTTQELTGRFGVGTHTIRQAMSMLEEEGLVKSTPRLGTVVSDAPSSKSLLNGNGKNDAPVTRCVAVFGLVQQSDSNDRLRRETAEGYFSELTTTLVSIKFENLSQSLSN